MRRRRAARLHRLPQLRQPREARDRLGARRDDRGAWRRPARRSACRSSRATSRSTTTPTAARSTRRRSSAASGSCPTSAASRAAGARATRSCSPARARRSRSPGSEAQARWGSLGGSPTLDLASEVALVRYASRAAPRASLVHDVAEGGLAVALAEAALWSGVGAELELDDDPLTLFGEGGGQVVVALPTEQVELDPTRRGRRRAADRRRSAATRSSGSPLDELATRARGGRALMCGVFGIRSRRARRRAAHVLRPLRAPAPRPGVGRDRRLRGRPRHRAPRDGARRRRSSTRRSSQALPGEVAIGHTRYSTTGGVHWSNAQPVVHHGSARTVALGHNGNLVEPDAAPRRAPRGGRAARLDLRHRGDRRAARPRPGAAPGGRRRDDAPARGRVLGRRDRRRHARRLPRPARDPAAHARPDRRRLGRRVGDLRARPRRRGGRARRRSRRGRLDRRRRLPSRAGACRAGASAACIFEHVYFARPDSSLGGDRRCTRRACGWASGSPRRRRPRPTS